MSNRQSGIITSPNYPNNYPHSFDESHTIEVEEGDQIHLEFTDFVLESHNNCIFDYVEGFNLLFRNQIYFWYFSCGFTRISTEESLWRKGWPVLLQFLPSDN